MESQITGVSIVCLTVCSCADQRKHQSSASLAFERGIYRSVYRGLWEGNLPVTGEFPSQKASNAEMFPFDDVIMFTDHDNFFLSSLVPKFQSYNTFNNYSSVMLTYVNWAFERNCITDKMIKHPTVSNICGSHIGKVTIWGVPPPPPPPLEQNSRLLIKSSLEFLPKGPIIDMLVI